MKVTIQSDRGSKREKYEFIDSDDDDSVKSVKSEKPPVIHTATLKRYDLNIEFDEKDFYKEHYKIYWDNQLKTWYWKGQISKIPHGLRLKLKKNEESE